MKIGLVSLGCPKNLVDSEVMLGLAERAGHEITGDAADADVLVVNTCAFIDSAKQESIDTILEMAQHKTGGRARRLVVTGCLAERYREELREQIPEIDAVLGTGEVDAIVGALEGQSPAAPGSAAPVGLFARGADGSAQPLSARHRDADAPLPTYLYDAATPRRLTTPGHYAYVKIAEGCDYNCAFCIIPKLRGAYRSRDEASVVAEARALAARGVKELLLVSQDTTFYGIDRDRQDRGALGRLLRALNAIEGLEWIRLLYLYPTTITAETIEAMAACEKVVRYIDLPLQHAAAAMLKRMRRPGTRKSYEALLGNLRHALPGVTLRTTFVVGFPGETEADVDELVDFIKTIEFDHVGVFTYSHQEGTAAASLDDDVPEAVKRKRQKRVMQVQQRIVARRQKARIGQMVRVVVDGPSKEHDLVLQGRLPGQAPEVDPVVFFTDCDPTEFPPGTYVDAEVVDAAGYDLIVRPVEALTL
ncbi:30S ribosomal protein S12 methylthiotransferase RimO [Luteitalea sp.]|jgi:ribosomal protein S12 methylthiotransferase|uniref:30S ribosomal protein S12 methylthiotransferase RimO n=1 Tax=Luteitalea sp. TaxID=2004800 RepID=UPI0037C537E3